MHFGEHLIKIREMRGITQDELAALTGLTQGAISHLETNKRQPNLATLCKIKRGLGLKSMDTLTSPVCDSEAA